MIDSPVIGLLFLGVLAAVPLLLRRVRASTPQGLRVMGRTALHKSAVVAVVAVGERRLLLGAGDRGVQLLTELDPEPQGQDTLTDQTDLAPLDLAPTGVDGRTDADRHITSTDLGTPEALHALLGPPGSSSPLHGAASSAIAGPGNGLVDRLRAMTVRTTPQHPTRAGLRVARGGRHGVGRPSRDPLRR